ncbi:MAG TPA: hypothetical protein DD379_00540 [Cyanobacteria bacterium UBA11162]|nr:hypothetical protein [Cyanobacteria bacterium UBA11162]
MSITGSLRDFSPSEIFRFIEKGQKTGLLSFAMCPSSQAKPQSVHYLWVQSGQIVAASNSLDYQGLVSLITQQDWVSDRVFTKLLNWCCPLDQPLGLCLKNHSVLSVSQLEKLFQVQILQQVCPLFECQDGWFKFDQNKLFPSREMTGLSIPATEATLIGLRWLSNWDSLTDQLPDPKVSLVSMITSQPHQRLDTLELKVWEFSKEAISLNAIAKELKLPVENVQQIAFRLIAADLVAVQENNNQLNSQSDSYPIEIALSCAIA